MTTRSAIVVREAEEDDLDRVVGVLRAANVEFEALLSPAFFRAYLANVLDVRSRLDESQLFVACEGDRIVGVITLYPDASKEGWGLPSDWTGIRTVAVEPSARGLGIGRRLVQHCIERSRALGANGVFLHTALFQAAAIVMYERVGFRRASSIATPANSWGSTRMSHGSRLSPTCSSSPAPKRSQRAVAVAKGQGDDPVNPHEASTAETAGSRDRCRDDRRPCGGC
jgi:predicted N-acetyltransferase YhbS